LERDEPEKPGGTSGKYRKHMGKYMEIWETYGEIYGKHMEKYGKHMEKYGKYPLVNLPKAIEHGH